MLPLPQSENVLITGTGADNRAMQAGGCTITWLGNDTIAADYPRGQTVGRAIAEEVMKAGDQMRRQALFR